MKKIPLKTVIIALVSLLAFTVWSPAFVYGNTANYLLLSFSASPFAGCYPLRNVDLSADVSGTASGDITYSFDCTNDGNWDKVVTRRYDSYTARNLCDYDFPGTYTARVKVERQGLSVGDTVQITSYSCVPSPTVDLRADNFDGPLSISYNDSITLSWTSIDANYCTASGDWSGSKTIFGSEPKGNLTSSKIYTLICWNSGGTRSDSVIVNVSSAPATATAASAGTTAGSTTTATGPATAAAAEVNGKAVGEAATSVSTGLTNNLLADSFFLPLIISLFIVWLFKSRILQFEEWIDKRKKKYQIYCSDKLLKLKIGKIKTEDFFRKKLF